MKKGVIFALLIFLFLFAFPLAAAELNTSGINKGFSCLASKTTDCAPLSLGEKIFASLATGQCTSSVESSAGSNGCFPSGSCNIKITSQAILALKNSGRSTTKSTDWLLTQSKPTTSINWYIQIDSNTATSCSVSYQGTPYSNAITVNADQTLSGAAGLGLSVSSNGYWLLINPSYYGVDFSISCDQQFKTTELYQREGFSTIYISSSSDSASAGGTVHNSVNSSCFGAGSSCDYDSSLWAALALDYAGKDVSSFIPYLTVMADDTQNQEYLPYSFLYALTSSSDFLEKLLSSQKTVNSQSYWDQRSASGPYFDTALALLPLQSQSPPEKTSALNWLASVQGSDGCWNSGNLADTAFILYSVSGSRATSSVSTSGCFSSGYFCLSSTSVCTQSGGSVLQGYTCAGSSVCCTHDLVIPTCAEQSGTICSSGQICSGGSTEAASGTQAGQTCCVGGTCAATTTARSACELANASCKSSCLDSEKVIAEACSQSSQFCCSPKGGIGIGLIILLSSLIVLALLGIIFRKHLAVLWLKLKSKFGKGRGGMPSMPPRPPFPPRGPPVSFQRRPPMFPSAPPHRIPAQQKQPKEINDVLSRLKDIGK